MPANIRTVGSGDLARQINYAVLRAAFKPNKGLWPGPCPKLPKPQGVPATGLGATVVYASRPTFSYAPPGLRERLDVRKDVMQ